MKRKQIICEPKPVLLTYYSALTSGDEDYDTIHIRQNLEVGNHWQASLTLDRWRTKEELAAYLRYAADTIEKTKPMRTERER